MVWFQCEDCGEELKKPKLSNHIRMCSATKLSCIDCGVTFGQDSVQGHTQCITEAEKYGPKGEGKTPNSKPSKTSKGQQKPDFDINVGLSNCSPWFCSLCRTKATGRQALLLHAEGKKHKAKARAFHVVNQSDKPLQDSTLTNNDSNKSLAGNATVAHKNLEDVKENSSVKPSFDPGNIAVENGNASIQRKRKVVSSGDKDESGNVNDYHLQQVNNESAEKTKKSKHGIKKGVEGEKDGKISSAKEIKWKKLIVSALKSEPDGVLKMKKLGKYVYKSIRECGIGLDDTELSNTLNQKVNSSSRFTVEGKYVRLAK